MSKKTEILDTNIIIRFLTQDSPQLSQQAEKIFSQAEAHQLEIPDFILTEIVWVLLSFYELKKEEVIQKLEAILAFSKFKLNRKILRIALDIYRNENISFVDTLLIAKGKANNQKVVSFDKRVNKLSFY